MKWALGRFAAFHVESLDSSLRPETRAYTASQPFERRSWAGHGRYERKGFSLSQTVKKGRRTGCRRRGRLHAVRPALPRLVCQQNGIRDSFAPVTCVHAPQCSYWYGVGLHVNTSEYLGEHANERFHRDAHRVYRCISYACACMCA
eukprot:6190997-Pleurochrysis_carterae.AAC.3